jgi:Putative Flp pilus-assembly TadE/G-like
MERGQITIFVVLVLGIFLLGFVGFATDYTNFWYHRQSVQGAADATCQAGAMDLLLYAEGRQTPNMNFTPKVGTAIDCKEAPTAAPCIIAKYNGYDGTLAANDVVLNFPSTVPGAPAPPAGVAVPYIQVDVTEQVPAYFLRMLSSKRTVPIHAGATCGLSSPSGPVPIVVLHPTDAAAINMKGAKDAITVVGGPQRSIQVNSSNQPSAVNLSTIDLSRAGPGNSGGDFAVFGGPATPPGSVNLGSTGHWDYPSTPISDPYARVKAPAQPAPGVISPALKGSACAALQRGCYKFNGCPDGNGCDEYTAGYYSTGIKVKNVTAIFDPGLYYVVGGVTLASNSNVRTSTATGDGSGGVMFYLSGSGSLSIVANSGKGTTDAYSIDGSDSANGVPSRALQCPGGAANPPGLPATVNGNILLGPCSGTYGDPTGHYRGFVFFQDRAAAATPSWQGGGSSIVSGFMYFHQCRADGTGQEPCSPPGAGGFGTTLNLGGNPGTNTYTIGSIVTDKIASHGNPGITMVLSPDKSFPQLKTAFLK